MFFKEYIEQYKGHKMMKKNTYSNFLFTFFFFRLQSWK